MVDFHSDRPGHDLRYGLDGTKMKNMGWSLPIDFEIIVSLPTGIYDVPLINKAISDTLLNQDNVLSKWVESVHFFINNKILDCNFVFCKIFQNLAKIFKIKKTQGVV